MVPGARQRIDAEVVTWPGVTTQPHRFGGTEYTIGRREIGHIHGDAMIDIPFPKKVRDELVATGQAHQHHILPETGWVSFYLAEPADVERGLALLRQSYQLAQRQKSHIKEAVAS